MANFLFRGITDRFIKEKIGKQSIDVGTERIADIAYLARHFLNCLGQMIERDINLPYEPTINGISIIEVYPTATLITHRIDIRDYKSTGGKKQSDKE